MATYSSTDAVWYSWHDQPSTTSTTWSQWNDSSTSTSTVHYYNQRIWVTWISAPTTGSVPQQAEQQRQISLMTPTVPNAEAPPQAPERRNDIFAMDYVRLEDKREKAEAKALDLLLDLIGAEQADIYKKTGNLLVKGNEYDWLLERGGKVFRVKKGKVTQMCVHSDKQCSQPPTDNVIALALHAKFAEKQLLKEANVVRDVGGLPAAVAANF